MENIFGLVTIPSIIVICYLAAEGVKILPLNNKYIPIICGILGGVLGVIGMFGVANFPAEDYLTAIAIGIVSGLASTGINQIFKQIGGGKNA